MREQRQRVHPFRAESFSLNLSGELRSAERGRLRRPPRGRRRTHGGGQKGRDTCGFPSSLNSYLSLVGIAWVQTVDCVSRKRTRQSGYRIVSFSTFSQFTDSVLLHIRLNLRRRGIAVPRNSFACYYGRHLRIIIDIRLYRSYPFCTIYPVGANSVRPHNATFNGFPGAQCAPLRLCACKWHTKRADTLIRPYGTLYRHGNY